MLFLSLYVYIYIYIYIYIYTNVETRISKNWPQLIVHFPMCACHPCAGAMLIFSESFQLLRMIPEGNPQLSIICIIIINIIIIIIIIIISSSSSMCVYIYIYIYTYIYI